MNPLNSILTLSDSLLEDALGVEKLTNRNRAMHARVVWSSAKFLFYSIDSQLSQMKICSNSYIFNYAKVSRGQLIQHIENVVKPFKTMMEEKEIQFNVF